MFLRTRSYSRNILVLFVIILFSSLSLNLISPIWPIYIKALAASMTELGYIFAISNAVAAVLQIISGWLSDRHGRRKLNAIGTFLGIFPPLFYLFARNWVDLIPWVILSGISTGLYMPIRWTIIADDSTVKTRALAYSWMNIAFLLGSTVAPLLGGLIADILDVRTPFVYCFALMSICFVFSMLLQETRRTSQEPLQTPDGAKISTFLWVVFIFSSLNLIQAVGIGIYTPVTPIFAKDKFSVDYTGVGLLYAIGFGLPSMIVQIPGGRLASKYSKKAIILVTIIFSAFSPCPEVSSRPSYSCSCPTRFSIFHGRLIKIC